jgi:predicted XRE-type DNA-binding protein
MVARGERHGLSKLRAEQVLDVYLLARSGLFYQRELAVAFGISRPQVSNIMHRKQWQHLWNEQEGIGTMAKVEIEETDLEELKARIAKLEKASAPSAPTFKREPYAPIDYTAGATMDRETKRDLARAIPDDLARDLRADLARGNPINQSVAQLTPDRGRAQVEIRGSGWANPNPLTTPAGLDICDRLVDMQDKIDKADLQRRLARSGSKE